jgi:5-(carboxyamino)imidazole ribonucleotide mutase
MSTDRMKTGPLMTREEFERDFKTAKSFTVCVQVNPALQKFLPITAEQARFLAEAGFQQMGNAIWGHLLTDTRELSLSITSQCAAHMEEANRFGPSRPLVGIVMGSASDWDCMQGAADVFKLLEMPCEKFVLSVHRNTDAVIEYAVKAKGRLSAIIAGAGGAAHLPGILAAKTTVPVLGVPVPRKPLKGLDSLLSIVQMPYGVPVATFAIGLAGARNAALFAAQMQSVTNERVSEAMDKFRRLQTVYAGQAVVPDTPPGVISYPGQA